MQKFRIVFKVVFILFFLNIACSGEPNIEFSESAHNFGIVKQQEEHSHVFTFKNTGDSTLIIEKVKAG